MARRNAREEERTLLQTMKEQLMQCAGFEGDRLATDRATAWRYYFQRPRGDEITGRSSVVSGDVSAMVDAVLSQMDDAFSSDHIVEYQAYDANDEDQAQLESDAVCDFVSRNNGNFQLLQGIKSALLLRNAIVKVWSEEKRDKRRREYTGVSTEALSVMLAPQPNIETEVIEYNPNDGSLTLNVIKVDRKLRFLAIPVARFFYPEDWSSTDLANCPFCAEQHIETRASVMERGFSKDKVDQLKKVPSEVKLDLMAQSPGGVPQQSRKGVDTAHDFVEWFEAYCFMDDGKGRSERHRISFSYDVLLEDVVEDLVPYGSGVVFINPNKFTGISLYDKLKQVQDISTGLSRALLDNVNTVNKNRLAYIDGVVNVDDVSDGRTNGSIRVRQGVVNDVRAAVSPFTIPDNSQGVLANIENQRQVRSEMGGAALTLATGELQLGDRAGSQGIDRAYSVMEQLSAHMVKNIAKTLIRSVYLLAHETMRRHFNYPVSIKKGGRWRTTTPSEWERRENVFIKVGMSPGERQRRVSMLNQMMSNQIALADKGMDEVLVNLDGFYSTMIDWARAGDIQNPERYFVDPQSPSAQKALKSKQDASAQTKQMQDQLITQAVALEQMRSAINKYQTDVETQFKYYEANLNAQIEEAKLVANGAVELLKARDAPKEKDITPITKQIGKDNGKPNGRGTEKASERIAG